MSTPVPRGDPRPARRRPPVRLVAAIIAALLVALAAGAGLTWRASAPPPPIVIAFTDSITGPLSALGVEARAATQLYINEVNDEGGIDGRMLKLEAYNDQGNPATATTKAGWVLDSSAVAVLGYSSASTASAAAQIYRQGRIALVTGTSDPTAGDNPYVFRAVTPVAEQGAYLARYIHAVVLRHTSGFLRAPDIDLVGGPGDYSASFLAGFQQPGIRLNPAVFMLGAQAGADDPAKALADQLAREAEPRIIVLGLDTEQSAAVLKAIRRRGIRSMVILSSAAATESFVQQFTGEPEETDEPGYFTDNLFGIAPVILDNTDLFGQSLASRYRTGTGDAAGWYAAGAQDAARMAVEAIRRAHIGGTDASRPADRDKVRDALAAMADPAHAVQGINGTLYFDPARAMPRPMHYGAFHEGRFLSAPLQLVPVKDRDLIDIDREIALGHMVQIDEQFFWLQRVVFTGIDIVHLDQIDMKNGTFNADFYFWMRSASGDDLPNRIEFSDFSGAFDPATPVQTSTEESIDYRLWHLSGTFKANFNLHDYPFDTQALIIRMRNRDNPKEQIVYAIDTFGLRLDASGRSGANSEAFHDLQLWRVVTVAPYVAAVSIQSTLGQPALFGTANRTEYASFGLAVLVQRNVLAFMIKALLPLFLLTLVVFSTLFFPHTMAKERLTIPVTGMLTSAVLLISITNQLPPLGYTVALEYIFYAFFVLCLLAMVTGLLSEIFRNKTFHNHAIRIDLFGRIAYLLVAALTVGAYWWKYGDTVF